MGVSISVRFRFGTYQGRVLEFNRHGITIELNHKLPVHKQLFVTLKHRQVHPETIVATAHNCRSAPGGKYLCGVRFRTDSKLQLDRNDVESGLRELEKSLAGLNSTATT